MNDERKTRREAAEYIGIAYSTLNQWASKGDPYIPHFKVGRKKTIYLKTDLDDFLLKSCVLPRMVK